MTALWLKFPDEILLCHKFTGETRNKLEQIFSHSDPYSPWMMALSEIGLNEHSKTDPLIKWHKNAPYFNWSYYISSISGGSVRINKKQNGSYIPAISRGVKHALSLIVSQWKIARFLARANNIEDRLVESIALGIALQGLIVRLGSDADKMEAWLASPEQIPKKHRKTIEQIQSIQVKRTGISDVWRETFAPSENSEEDIDALPEYFWGDQIPDTPQKNQPQSYPPKDQLWQGKSVRAGHVAGISVLIGSHFDQMDWDKIKNSGAPLILIFRSARPETTELFEHADAIIFCNGGVLSHACTIAREMNIPCITAVGSDFYEYLQDQKEQLWIQIVANNATVKIIDNIE